MYGPIKKVKIIRDLQGSSRGYAFVEYEHKNDFKNAYKKGDRKRIDESRVHVDYERGRTEKNWKPRRFGGGKGESRAFPQWLEKELNEIIEFFPELLFKNRKEEKEESPKRKRSRSRHDQEVVESKKFVDKKVLKEENNGTHNHHQDQEMEQPVPINEFNFSNEEDEEKKKKREKKEKKSKKDKKSKTDKKEKRDKRVKEEGEII